MVNLVKRYAPWNRLKPSSKIFLQTVPRLLLWITCVNPVMFDYAFVRVFLLVPCGRLLVGGWPLGSRLWCLIVKLSLSHWYPGSGVVLDCIDSWSLPFSYYQYEWKNPSHPSRLYKSNFAILYYRNVKESCDVIFQLFCWLLCQSLGLYNETQYHDVENHMMMIKADDQSCVVFQSQHWLITATSNMNITVECNIPLGIEMNWWILLITSVASIPAACY